MPQEQIKTRSPFELREQHFYSSGILSNPIVKALPDSPSDKDWSNNIDKIIADLGFNEALLFGGRDNSIEGYYSGKHPIKIIEQVGIHSSTSIRKSIAKNKPEQSLAPGIIWGDGITPQTIDKILSATEKWGWAASNFAFGSGGDLMQNVNRDTLKMAIKCSAIKVNGEWRDVYKDPITDQGKKSLRGRQENPDFITVFKNGQIINS